MRIDTITEIVVAAATYDLTDLATVHDELRIPTGTTTDDPFLTRAITQVSTAIQRHCNRVFAVETVRDVVYPERDDYPFQVPGGVSPLQLTRWPVIGVASVVVADGPGSESRQLSRGHYRVDARNGQLVRLDRYTKYPSPWYPVRTLVTYEAGYAVIPADLVDVALRLITSRFYSRGRDPTLKSQSQPGLGDQAYWVGSVPGVKGPFPEDMLAVLDSYRVPVVA